MILHFLYFSIKKHGNIAERVINLAGALFVDSGKTAENGLPDTSFKNTGRAII
jgi:hypothetical protein